MSEIYFETDVLDFGGPGDAFDIPIPLPDGSGGGAGGGSGGWWDTAEGILDDIGFWDWLGGALGFSGGSVGSPSSLANALTTVDKQKGLLILQKSPDLITSFLSFLEGVGVYGSFIAQLVSSSILEWPSIIQDIILYWTSKNAPSALTEEGQAIGLQVPPEYKDPAGGGGSMIGPPLPSPIGGSPITVTGGLLPPVMDAVPTMVYKAPKGYVTVTNPADGKKYFVIKEYAYKMGLAKRRAKAPISAKEYRYIKKAKTWENKLARMLGDSCNFKVTKKRR